ncbi:MAG: AlwI family type II restriction endonuclease [Planctomycetes bacterium]|nr:AlwI family type II restriction endonuclease [Planctomycetota bacterium]
MAPTSCWSGRQEVGCTGMKTLANDVLGRLCSARAPFDYLNQYEKDLRPVFFEELAVMSFAGLLHLPFYDAQTDDLGQPLRATWRGSRRDKQHAPGNASDGLIHAVGYSILVEATLSRKSDQWKREFAAAIRHAKAEEDALQAGPQDVYCALVAPEISDDTFESIRSHNERAGCKLIPLELQALAQALETSAMAFTLRHADVRRLFIRLVDCIKECPDTDAWRKETTNCLSNWQREVLKHEKSTMLAIKSYEAIIRSGRKQVAMSDILVALNSDRTILSYFEAIQESFYDQIVEQSLLQESLVVETSKLDLTGERFLVPISLADFCSRCDRRRKAIEGAHQRGS